MTADKHCRSVEDWSFQIESNLVSDKQCKIYRKKITDEDTQQSSAVFLKATRSVCCLWFFFFFPFGKFSVFLNSYCVTRFCSNESTFLNWRNLRKNSPGLKMQHGDIIWIPVPPHHGNNNNNTYGSYPFILGNVKGS